MPNGFENARVFVTVYSGNIQLARKLLQSAEATGNETSKFIFVGTDGNEVEGFRNLPLDLPQGNPVSVNRAFMEVARLCHSNGDDFIMFDADVTFVAPDAVERLSWEFSRKEGAVMAQPHYVFNDKFNGWCWNGNAIYRKDAWVTFDLANNPVPDDEPFDLFLSKKYFQRYCAPTGLISQTENKMGVKDLEWLNPQCVVHHACSDGSVADRVMEKYFRKEATNA